MEQAKKHSTIITLGGTRGGPETQRGQTVVIALLVLLLLAFVGALFVTIVARNLSNAGHQTRVLTADYYAEAGLRYADDQLTHGWQGADWRPPTPVPAVAASSLDPDNAYLNSSPPFTRYNVENGRFLIRVSYNPVTSTGSVSGAPLARYMKIESVGREGNIVPTDPTTFSAAGRGSAAAVLVAYKAIGITDYSRFETNIDNRSDVAAIGVPGFYDIGSTSILTPGVFDLNSGAAATTQFGITTTYGAMDAYIPGSGATMLLPNPAVGSNPPASGAIAGGGSFRSNLTTRFFGLNNVYLNTDVLDEKIEIAGNILLDHFDPNTTTTPTIDKEPASVIVNSSVTGAVFPAYVRPSANSSTSTGGVFDTFQGTVRDGASGANGNDANGYPRQVQRLDPPFMDYIDPVTSLSRYQDMAINSPARETITDPDAGRHGLGRTVFIDNGAEVQPESSGVSGYTLEQNWLNRIGPNGLATDPKNGWSGDLYTPPGVDIIFGQLSVAAGSVFGIKLVRHDVDPLTGAPRNWRNPDGTPGNSPALEIPYSQFGAVNDPTTSPTDPSNPNNDIVIVTLGNAKIRGSVSADSADTVTDTSAKFPRHITIVSYATAYIDGNLLKGNPDSSIAILARDYICVNTTQFMAGASVPSPGNTVSPGPHSDSGTGDNFLDFTTNTDPAYLVQEFSFGLVGSNNTPRKAYGANNLALYYSGEPDASGLAQADFLMYDPRSSQTSRGTSLTDPNGFFTYSGSSFAPITFDSASEPLHSTYDLTAAGPGANPSGILDLLPSHSLQFAIRQHEQPVGVTTYANLLIHHVAVLPMDIRIEAVLYAQNKSFFVIPGPWFNTDTQDNLDAYKKAAVTGGANAYHTRHGVNSDDADQGRYPFHGQPIDLKITISGTVSEAHPADIGAQTEWMRKWGWIPQFHGNKNMGASPETSGHSITGRPAVGLSIIYDPLCAYPYNGTRYLRQDIAGNPLPFAPCLPVCEGLLYSGQPTNQPTN